MTEHSFGCIADQEAMGLYNLSRAQVYQKPKEMTEELKQKAEDYVDKELKPPVIKPMVEICQECMEFGYNKGKKEQKRNTQIVAHLNDCISEAQNKKIAELEAQIEKMKRCFNCKYHNKFIESKCGECEDYSKWELAND